MKELTKKELNDIEGGAISGSFITAIVKGTQIIYEISRNLGSIIRRLIFGRYC